MFNSDCEIKVLTENYNKQTFIITEQNKQYFIKVYFDSYSYENFLREVSVLGNIGNYCDIKKPEIIYIYDKNDIAFFVTTVVNGTTLNNYIKNNIKMDDCKNGIVKKICHILNELHSVNYDPNFSNIKNNLTHYDVRNSFLRLNAEGINLNHEKEILGLIINYGNKFRNKVLTHGDLSRNNLIVDDDEIYLIDFEFASWNDAAYDIALLTKYDKDASCIFCKEDIINSLCSFENIETKDVYVNQLIHYVVIIDSFFNQYKTTGRQEFYSTFTTYKTFYDMLTEFALSKKLNETTNYMSNRFANKSDEEHKYTSTGIKFWRHKEAMNGYREKNGNTIISTHISPEGACNLSCHYCSVSKRDNAMRIELTTIKKYVDLLITRGLKAVVLTGGGEPVLYPHFNELVRWLKNERNLSVALITNGTLFHRISDDVLDMFSWIRISINLFQGYEGIIKFPIIKGVLGASLVYTGQTVFEMKIISEFVPSNVEYIRVVSDCLLDKKLLIEEHKKISSVLNQLNDKRFFRQFKIYEKPQSEICHQAYFRPYLSEVNGGTVFPCDSLVLNNGQRIFNETYAICATHEVLDFMDGKIKLPFNASKYCNSCVFTENLKILDDWLVHGINMFEKYTEELTHEEFI